MPSRNNIDGTCGWCNTELPTLLPEGPELKVVPPENAVPNNSRAVAEPKTYAATAAIRRLLSSQMRRMNVKIEDFKGAYQASNTSELRGRPTEEIRAWSKWFLAFT
jgi:hypothetical protein